MNAVPAGYRAIPDDQVEGRQRFRENVGFGYDEILVGAVIEADDIGAAVPAILSEGFGWANGTRIELSGGQNL